MLTIPSLFCAIICYVLYYMYSQTKKMHDLYATMHIFQMVLPDAFWAV